MACQVIVHSWTFSRLVGAFLDLAIAYFLLCCSAIAFFLSKFLALLGLTLPCPCNGLFGYPTRSPCFQRFLVDCPAETISSLHFSLKSKFPFDSILSRNDHSQLNLKLLREGYSDDGVLHLEGEASYSSFSDPRRSHHSLSGTDSISKCDIKGKAATTHRPRFGLRRRRRASIDYGKLNSASSYDHLKSDSRAIRRSPSDSSKFLNVQNPTTVNFCDRTLPDSESNDAADESKPLYDYATLFENLKNNVGIDGEDENIVKILELALEEEHAARVELFSELEQERLAAASAADEAMAMISRLQEEKASIEIEARQYQRILEEKSVYDAEEMDLLKEIIVRREREKHFLEKEVEAYRKVFQVNNGWDSQSYDTERQNEVSAPDPSVDPTLILHQLSQSIDNRENIESINYPDNSSVHVQKKMSAVSEGKGLSKLPVSNNELQSPECSSIIPDLTDDEANQDIQEKGMLSVDAIPSSQEGNNEVYLQQKTICGADGGKQMPPQVVEPRVHDVHIIDSKHSIHKNTDGKEGDPLIQNSASDLVRQCDSEFSRSSSEIFDRFPTASSSPDRSFVPSRNSISAVDHERLKIDDEICWLQARLRTVQEEKEKLKGSFEHQEREKTELKLLEDIAIQLREIRHLTAPEKAARQASLPPLSSKVTSKKRRSRGVSVGVGQSQSS